MEFLFGFCNGWMRQRILKGLLHTILRHVMMLTFAFFISFSISIMSIRAMMPVEQSRMFMVLHDSPSDLEDDIHIKTQNNYQEVIRYYGFVNLKQSPTAGFPYEVQLSFRHRTANKPTMVVDTPKLMKGKLRLTFRSTSGVPVVAKNAGFKINLNDSSDASEFIVLNEFPVGKLLAPVSDGNLFLLCDNCSYLFGHVEVTFKLDCHYDMYTRLLCYRPTKWAIIGWTMVALSSAFMTVITSTLVATKIVNVVLSEFVRIIFNKTSNTLSNYRGHFMDRKGAQPVTLPSSKITDAKINDQKPQTSEQKLQTNEQKPLPPSDPSSESIDDLLNVIRAASAHQVKNSGTAEDKEKGVKEPDTPFQCPVIVIDTSNLSDEEDKADKDIANDSYGSEEEIDEEAHQLWSHVIKVAADHISSDEEQHNRTDRTLEEEPCDSKPTVNDDKCSGDSGIPKESQQENENTVNENTADDLNKDSKNMNPEYFQEDALNGLSQLIELLKKI